MNSKFFIIDGYGFVFRAYHSLPPLTNAKGFPVGAVFGFSNMLMKLIQDFRPEHAVIVFDSGSKNFRHELFSAYKANRKDVDNDLILQFPLIREVAQLFNFCTVEKEGFEADDIIATLTKEITARGFEVVIVSSDKDLMQLVSEQVKMFDSMKNKYIGFEQVKEKFGVEPSQVVDVLAIMGDSSDNVPGVKGIGPKGAAELILEYSSLENLYDNIDKIKQSAKKSKLIESQSMAFLSKKLVSLDYNVEINITLDQMKFKAPDLGKLNIFFEEHNFKSLLAKAKNIFQLEDKSLDNSNEVILKSELEPEELSNYLSKSIRLGKLVIMAVNSSFLLYNLSQNIILIDDIKRISSILADDRVLKITFDLKSIINQNPDIVFKSCDDISLMYYICNAGKTSASLEDIFINILGDQLPDIKKISLDDYCKIIYKIDDIHQILIKQISINGNLSLYYDIDLPLIYILAKMEQTGVLVNKDILVNLSSEFNGQIIDLEQNIFKLAGEEFNIASPKQLANILFNKLGLPSSKKSSKTDTLSTGADVLEDLSMKGYEIVDYILSWRQLSKLKNTYTDALVNDINQTTGRVHSSFSQTSTSTSRLSSHNPNLQNIPIRTENGNKIRKAFIASPGYKMISADYSQIELRLLAHIANIESLITAFLAGEDIHKKTAEQIFGIQEIGDNLRRSAKAINFGIIYGISSFGLAKQLNISVSEAAKYIEQYFNIYPGIKEYMNNSVLFARQHGYINNLYGRRCYVTQITNSNFALRNFAERAAINAPLQSTSSEITKRAMISIDKYLKKNKMATKLILQIHDELIFEAPENEVDLISSVIKNIMQNIISLKVPLEVNISCGDNWGEL